MSSSARRAAIQHISARPAERPDPDRKPRPLTEIFGLNVFNDGVQRQRLPRNVYVQLRQTTEAGLELDSGIADSVASAMRDWAVERGATHFTHWFQPMTGATAEKHDSFISLSGDDRIINEFSGAELIRGEPDASSFPSGGLRTTFEARGYTAWDATSPAFLREGPNGLTLCIPTVFCSWTGEALDKKTPLLRSDEAISRAATRLVNMLGNSEVTHIYSTIGCEQEYFLIDRSLAALRPDLLMTGRTLFGARPPKGQELADHYFGAISQRALGFMQELETELWKLGIPVKTRHNEVAPLQFELAPIYKKARVAIDQNMLMMEMLRIVAERHGFSCLLHEKPFAGINGSGKHTNWSLADNLGNNMLEPGDTPHQNLQFILFLTAIIRAVDLHGDLMRVSIAHAANDHRLGANEAPPAIISVFLGAQLEGVIDMLLGKEAPGSGVAGGEIRLGVSTLPPLPRDIADRNRTSPFAFTGNKFEFRAVGSSQSVAYPATFLNTIVAESIDFLADSIEARAGKGDLGKAIQEVVAETLTKHRRILFSGDNYSSRWATEAERRGLPNLRDTAAALTRLADPDNVRLFESMGVLTARETESRLNVLYENYVHAIRIEALTTFQLASTLIVPSALRYQRDVAGTILETRQALAEADAEGATAVLRRVSELISGLQRGLDDLDAALRKLDTAADDLAAGAELCRNDVLPAQAFVRDQADRLESLVDDDYWPLPPYRELLFNH